MIIIIVVVIIIGSNNMDHPLMSGDPSMFRLRDEFVELKWFFILVF